jgi:hypothetical protein
LSDSRDPVTATTVGPTAVPGSALLSTWNSYEWRDGIRVDHLSPLTRLTVSTRNTTYEMVIVLPATGEILVRGGAFFPDFTPARLAGSSLGGSFLKLRSIFIGFHLEIATAHGTIITSPVRMIEIVSAAEASAAVM